jgi:hypothetical protein
MSHCYTIQIQFENGVSRLEGLGEIMRFTTIGPMQITIDFGGARSLCRAHFFTIFFFILFNKKFLLLIFIFVKNQHFLFPFSLNTSFFSLIIWRHFRSDESGPVFLHFYRKIYQLKNFVAFVKWLENLEWILFKKPFYCRNEQTRLGLCEDPLESAT